MWAYLGLGGNLGDPAANMAQALRLLDSRDDTTVERVSSLYRTKPWGKLDQPDFLNAVVCVTTALPARELLGVCLDIERALKRERRERWGPRLIDIDVLLYGEDTIRERDLEIPHPRMTDRAFVLVPLLEIAPDLIIGGKPVADHAETVGDQGIEKLAAGDSWYRTGLSGGPI